MLVVVALCGASAAAAELGDGVTDADFQNQTSAVAHQVTAGAKTKPSVQTPSVVTPKTGLYLKYLETPRYKSYESSLKKTRALERAVAIFNQKLALPARIPVELTECGFANAFYDYYPPKITLCYEKVERDAQVFLNATTIFALERIVGTAAQGALAHELGHGMIHFANIPTSGPNGDEDSADEFGALAQLWWLGDDINDAIVRGSNKYLYGMQNDAIGKVHASDDPHSSPYTRAFNILCLAHGKYPQQRLEFMRDIFSEKRLKECEERYAEKDAFWRSGLKSYLKDSPPQDTRRSLDFLE